jgi:hypothetical protein
LIGLAQSHCQPQLSYCYQLVVKNTTFALTIFIASAQHDGPAVFLCNRTQPDVMNLFFLIIAGLLVGSAHRVLFYRMRKGYFFLRSSGQHFSLIDTNFGKFQIDYRRAKMALESRWSRKVVALDDVSALQFRHRDETALYEEACEGFDVTDLLPAYRDRIHWYTIKLVLRDGTELPLFTAGEYEPREFLAGWLLDLEAGVLQRLGLKPDVAEHARTVLDSFLAEFKKAGKAISLQ